MKHYISFYQDDDTLVGAFKMSVLPEAGSHVVINKKTYKLQAIFHFPATGEIRALLIGTSLAKYPGITVDRLRDTRDDSDI